ncbi:hypothetical protein [Agromyces humi]|uniref:hypothetical protein n=1 Tax=Agromyces humi TaxID=1766800 RepID=UPI00135681C4|nr:hypothetical protein [Agromyces humi]
MENRTLADVIAASSLPVTTGVDYTTPDGHFGATAVIVGVLTAFTLRGEIDDPAAVIVERIEFHQGRSHRYVGGGLKGGVLTKL